jgi:hypothetical protein
MKNKRSTTPGDKQGIRQTQCRSPSDLVRTTAYSLVRPLDKGWPSTC